MKISSIVLFGPPYAGKGTVGKKFALLQPKLFYVATGDLVRQTLKTKSPLADEITSYISKGILLPDALILQLFTLNVEQLIREKVFDPEKHILLIDGIPRTLAQAQTIAGFIDVRAVIHFTNLPNAVLAGHNRKRVAEMVAAGKSPRVDDSPEACARRIHDYYTDTFPTLDFFSDAKVPILCLDALGRVDDVVARMSLLFKKNEFLVK